MGWPSWEQKQRIFDKLGYGPHEGQAPGHRFGGRVIAVVGAERSGKSKFVALEVVARVPWCKAGVAICAQEYDETHSEMLAIIEGLERLDGLASASTPKSGKWIVMPRGGPKIETISLNEGPQELTGTGDPFSIVALVEWGLIRYNAFLAAVRRTSETRGLVLCSGTLQDNVGWQVDIYNVLKGMGNVYDGAGFRFPAWYNRVVFPGGRDDEEIKRLERILPADDFARTVAAEIVASPARIYPEFDTTTHVGEEAFDREQEVWLAVDAGYYPSHYAVAVLQVGMESFELAEGGVVSMEVVRQVDEVWEHYLTHGDVFELCRERPWWMKVRGILFGHEGKQHQAAASAEEVWTAMVRADEEMHPRVRMPKGWRGNVEDARVRVEVFDAGRVMDGVVRVKTFLRDPGTGVARYRCDARCTGTQYEFGHYKRRTTSAGEVVGDEPMDKDNDVMDALRNWMVWRFGLVEVVREPRGGRERGTMRG